MIELIVTIGITASSMLLFAYWFRYTCLLVLSARTARDYATQIATANQLSFLQVQSQLQAGTPDFDRLRAALDRDYEIISKLIQHAHSFSYEERALALHYGVMRVWYGVTRTISSNAASQALEEMAQVVAHFANSYGEQLISASAA